MHSWSSFFKRDVSWLEQVCRLVTRMVEGQSEKPYDQRSYKIHLSLFDRRHRRDLMETSKTVNGSSADRPDGFHRHEIASCTRGHKNNSVKIRSKPLVRLHLTSKRVVNIWN